MSVNLKKVLLGLALGGFIHGGNSQAAESQLGVENSVDIPVKSCQSVDHRAFDFWLGEWQVTSPGRQGWQARSAITLGNGGCSLHEAYSTPGGYAGTSINFWDPNTKQWNQTWIDNSGAPLYLKGGRQGSSMVMADGQNRITWTPQPGGGVRQHWEATQDQGKTYTTVFDGLYKRLVN